MVRGGVLGLSLALALTLLSAPGVRSEPSKTARIQAALDAWVAARAAPEMITGVATYVSFGDPGPAIEAFSGRVGVDPRSPLVRQDTLFQMGSTSKSFAVAVVLKLEAAGKLSINDPIGKWLPQYPAWKDVTLRRLLNMTSGLPNYSEAEVISRGWIDHPARDLAAEDLIAVAYPTGRNDLPPTKGYSYSNTNYILAGMIAAKAAGRPYRDLVHEMVIDAVGLDSTFYEDGAYPAAVTRRLAHGYFDNPACTDYQPGCEVSWNKPLLGHDVSGMSTSWAQAAGGAISNARDVDRWMRAVFEGHLVPPKQQAEWMSLISTKTGEPIADVSAADPRSFALGLSKAILPGVGPQWFYQGETLGFRTLYVWFPKENMMITLQTNSQPAADADKLHVLLETIHTIAASATK